MDHKVGEGMTSIQYVVHKEGETGTLKERSVEQDISIFKAGLFLNQWHFYQNVTIVQY